ncbi:MAG: hypothetical protein JO320_22855 [Alphaproteobacteria bacterium]|nr:hypothetical protein [Alphaproteobacteria bacterium]MBV9377850.1 hypothetical protein [Alphaproteobacteria bacterium]
MAIFWTHSASSSTRSGATSGIGGNSSSSARQHHQQRQQGLGGRLDGQAFHLLTHGSVFAGQLELAGMRTAWFRPFLKSLPRRSDIAVSPVAYGAACFKRGLHRCLLAKIGGGHSPFWVKVAGTAEAT